MSSVPPPSRLGRYDILRRLGVGGMAEVYLARSRGAEGTQKLVVLKRILPSHTQSARVRQMFVDEARLSMRLNHPNIVQVFDFQESPEGFLLCMEYVEGLDLGRLMATARAKGARIPAWVGGYIVMEAARGLHCAHERKGEDHAPLEIVHRDVSPQNVLLSYDGGVKVADFGIASAKNLSEDAGVLKGKFAYMSPEQARAEPVDRRTDIYALGVVLHEILTGRQLYAGLGGEELLSIVRRGEVEAPSVWAAGVPPELDAICMRALAPSRDGRYATARDMAGAIARALQRQDDLIDAAAVEATISQLSGRELTSPGDHLIDESNEADAAPPSIVISEGISQALAQAEVAVSPGVDRTPGLESSSLTAVAIPIAARRESIRRMGPGATGRIRAQRELRHVALVHLQIHGLDELALDLGPGAMAMAVDRARSVLDGIAFKRGARWTWGDERDERDERDGRDERGDAGDAGRGGWGSAGARDGRVARAVVGLTSNSSAAPFEAAALALDVHDALADLSTDLPVVIAASIGVVRAVASGERDAAGHLMNHAVSAPAPALADVLAIETPPGKTWVAGGLYRLVRREFQWGDAPTLTLPNANESAHEPTTRAGGGLPESLRAYALVRALTREERLAELAMAPGELVGRDAQRADLHAAYHHAVAAPGLVSRLIVGEMGIGKTALVATFLREIPPDGRSIRVECAPSHAEVPFAAIGDLVRDACGLSGHEAIPETMAAIRAITAMLVGGDGDEGEMPPGVVERLAEVATGRQVEVGGDDDAGFRRNVLVRGVRRLLAALASRGPVVVVAEGAHWMDRPSLELLGDLLRPATRAAPVPILVLLVARNDERVAPLLSALPGIVRVELGGLSNDEQLRLLEMRLGAKRGVGAVCTELTARVGGNPFFLLETVDALLERGALELRSTPEGVDLVRTERAREIPLPSTLEQLLAERLRELPADEREVAQWIAVAGGPVEIAVLHDIARVGERVGEAAPISPPAEPPATADDAGGPPGGAAAAGPVHAALEEAVTRMCARGLIDRRGDAVDLRHPVARDVAYMTIEPAGRARMHRRLGERLRSTPAAHGLTAAIIARHLARGESPAAAAEMYLEAAHAARTSFQTQLATRYYHRVLTLLPGEDARRFTAHEALESIYRVIGRRRERRHHLLELRELARKLRTPRAITVALLRLARFDLDEGHLVRGLPVAQKAVAIAEATRLSGKASGAKRRPGLLVEAHALVSDLLRELGDVSGALRAADEALARSTETGVPSRLRADVLRAKGILLRRAGRTGEAVDVYAESIAILRTVGAKRSEARTKSALAYAMMVLARYEDAIALAVSSVAIDLSIGGRFQIAKTLTTIGRCYARLGDLPRALAYLERARDAHVRYGDQDGRTDTLLVTAQALLEAADLDGAASYLGDARALVAVTGNAYDATQELITRALYMRARGDVQGAADVASQARPLAQSRGLASFHVYATSIEAEARAELGELTYGARLAHTGIELVDAMEGSEFAIEVRAMCAHALDLAGDQDAPAAYERARATADGVLETIREPRFRALFQRRGIVERLMRSPAEDMRASVGGSSDPSGSPEDWRSDAADGDPMDRHREEHAPAGDAAASLSRTLRTEVV